MPSVLWRCWLGGRKGIRPVKNEWWGAGMVICLERGADLHMANLMPLPLTVSCFSKIQIGFTFQVLAHPGSPGKGLLNGWVLQLSARFIYNIWQCLCGTWQTMFHTISIYPQTRLEGGLQQLHSADDVAVKRLIHNMAHKRTWHQWPTLVTWRSSRKAHLINDIIHCK